MFCFMLSLYHKRNDFCRNKEKFIVGVRLFVESCIIGFVFITKRRRYEMFNNGERFYILTWNVAWQQKSSKCIRYS